MKAFFALGAIVSVGVLSVMASVLAVMMASNQATRSNQLYVDQAYYSAHGALEFASRQIIVDGNPKPIPSRYLLSRPLSITRTGGKVNVTGSMGSASATYSISDKGTLSCFYILNSSATGVVSLTGSSKISASSCSMNVNSSSATAVTLVASSNLTVQSLKIKGGYSTTGSSTITTQDGTIQTGASTTADPLLAYNVPSYSSCDYTNKSITGSVSATLSPGVYCGGLSITGSGAVTLNPGTYIMDGSTFTKTGTSTITGTNVTIILSGKISGTYSRLSIAGSGAVTLSAPTSGTYSGIVMFQDRNAPTSGTNTINGTTTLSLTGAIYLPNQKLTFTGGSSASAPCTIIIVDKLSISGPININCPTGTSFPF